MSFVRAINNTRWWHVVVISLYIDFDVEILVVIYPCCANNMSLNTQCMHNLKHSVSISVKERKTLTLSLSQ